MRLRCPKDPDHARFTIACEDIIVVDRDGEATGKTYDGEAVSTHKCTECDVDALDDHSFQIQSLTDGDTCPCCGNTKAITRCSPLVTCKHCDFEAELVPAMLRSYISTTLRGIGVLCGKLQAVGGTFSDVIKYLVEHEILSTEILDMKVTYEETEDFEVEEVVGSIHKMEKQAEVQAARIGRHQPCMPGCRTITKRVNDGYCLHCRKYGKDRT